MFEGGKEADTRGEVVLWKGWYSVQRETARVACVRRVDAGEGEDEERTFPVDERRRRVCRLGVVCVERKVERGFVRSIVCDIVVVAVEVG